MSFRASNAKKFVRPLPMIDCAQCGEQLFDNSLRQNYSLVDGPSMLAISS